MDYENYQTKIAVFGMGCFWHSESVFGRFDGVKNTRAGYSGGVGADPTYDNIQDHTEVVEVEYYPEKISYNKLLKIFWNNHPFDSKTDRIQYKSLILHVDENQKKLAEKSVDFTRKIFGTENVHTETKNFVKFFEAENYHQKHYMQINKPRLGPILNSLVDWKNLANSDLATKINGYLYEIKRNQTAKQTLLDYGLSEAQSEAIVNVILFQKIYMSC